MRIEDITCFFSGRREAHAAELGPYVLGPKIGEGGAGVVYRARHRTMKKAVAIKMLAEGRTDACDRSRLEQEARIAGSLASPNTVSVFDCGRTRDGSPYLVMEYVDGFDLRTLVSTFGALPAARVVHLLRQVASALGEMHALGLVHRDVKPANVGVSFRAGVYDAAKLLDFGLAARAGDAPSAALVGTPGYLAPETILSGEAIDPRSDIYSLGALAYFLATGSEVFRGASLAELCFHHLHSQPERPSLRVAALPADLEQVILRCLEKDPAARFQSAADLETALAACECAGDWSATDSLAWWNAHRPYCLAG